MQGDWNFARLIAGLAIFIKTVSKIIVSHEGAIRPRSQGDEWFPSSLQLTTILHSCAITSTNTNTTVVPLARVFFFFFLHLWKKKKKKIAPREVIASKTQRVVESSSRRRNERVRVAVIKKSCVDYLHYLRPVGWGFVSNVESLLCISRISKVKASATRPFVSSWRSNACDRNGKYRVI